MKQHSLDSAVAVKQTRRRDFLDGTGQVVPWPDMAALVFPYLPEVRPGRPPFSTETVLRIQLMQQLLVLSDPAIEAALHDLPVSREFAGLEGWAERLPAESTNLQIQHALEKQKIANQVRQTVHDQFSPKGAMPKSGAVVDVTLIDAPSSSKNGSSEREPEMKQSRTGRHWYLGMKCHTVATVASGLDQTVRGTSDVIEAHSLVRDGDQSVFADAGYQVAGKRPEGIQDVGWQIAMRAGKRGLHRPGQTDRAGDQEAGAREGWHTRAGRTLAPNDQAPVRSSQSALQRSDQEHRATAHAAFALLNLWMVRRPPLQASA